MQPAPARQHSPDNVGVDASGPDNVKASDEEQLPQDILDEIAASHASLLEGMMLLNDGIF
jgi:hypothetical protein